LAFVVFRAGIAIVAFFRDAAVQAAGNRVAHIQSAWICVITVDFNTLACTFRALIIRSAITSVVTGLIVGFILTPSGRTAGVKGANVIVVTVFGSSNTNSLFAPIINGADFSVVTGGAVLEGGRDTLARRRIT
jgi:hypothetical protein